MGDNMRLVDADALMESLKESADRAKKWYEDCKTYNSAMIGRAEQTIMIFNECGLRIKNAPTVDAVPVKRGYWIRHDWAEETEGCLIPNYECSVCHAWKRDESDYCPDCGSDMRGEYGKTD